MNDYPTLMMRTFVVIVSQHLAARGLGHSAFARKCWPESSPAAAAMRWQAIRTKSRNSDKPQGVLIFDAQRMATALDIDLAYLMLECTTMTKHIASKSKKNKQLSDKNEE